MIDLVIQTLPLADLSLMPREIVPIVHTDRGLAVTGQLISQNGQPLPILVQRSTHRIFWGGDLWIQAKALGRTDIAAVLCDVDDLEAAAIAVRLQRASELTTWDEKALAELLAQMEEPEAFGFTDEEFEALLGSVAPPKMRNTTPDPGPALDSKLEYLRGKWKTEVGQLWEIPSASVEGRAHRLICGDSTQAAVVRRLMNGERAALFATDPPYVIGYTGDDRPNGAGKDWSQTYHDFDTEGATADDREKAAHLYRGYMRVALDEAIADHAAWYCWHATKRQKFTEEMWNEAGAFLHQVIIWVKPNPTFTHSWYRWSHEPCLFGWVEGKKPKRVASKEPGTIWQADNPHGFGVEEDRFHPTPKPPLLFQIPMEQHTEPREICYEPFSGSGSQMAAGEQIGRLVYGCELSPFYVAGILERMSQMGLKPQQVASN